MNLFEVRGVYMGDDPPRTTRLLLEDGLSKAGATGKFVHVDNEGEGHDILGRCRSFEYGAILPRHLPPLIKVFRDLHIEIGNVTFENGNLLRVGSVRAKVKLQHHINFRLNAPRHEDFLGEIVLMMAKTRDNLVSITTGFLPYQDARSGMLEVTMCGPERDCNQEAGTDCGLLRDRLLEVLDECRIQFMNSHNISMLLEEVGATSGRPKEKGGGNPWERGADWWEGE